jgi:hypothetical protein
MKPSPTDDETSVLSGPECGPDAAIASVGRQNDHMLRRFFETTALPNLGRPSIKCPTWERGPGELFLGLATRAGRLRK